MDAVRNPYAPGAGTRPPELAGRAELLQSADIMLQRVAIGRHTKSMILVGLRGVGKTVLLNEIDRLADNHHFLSLNIEAHDQKSLPALIVPGIRQMLIRLSGKEKAKAAAHRGLSVLKGFVKHLRVKIGEVEIGLEPERGTADSGDLEADLPELFVVLGEAAKAANWPIAILVDELQYLSTAEFSALIMAIHKVNQQDLPVIVIGAGLPQILGLAGNSKSYAERLFTFSHIGALTRQDAIEAIAKPAKEEGVSFMPTAIDEIIKRTDGYPYFIQQWAYEAWNYAENSPIPLSAIKNVTEFALYELDQSFFKVRLDRCTPSEKKYMRALAELGVGVHRSSDIAAILGVKPASISPTRSSLIKKGMIYSPSYGDTEFTVPLFDQYMKRVMPNFDFKNAII